MVGQIEERSPVRFGARSLLLFLAGGAWFAVGWYGFVAQASSSGLGTALNWTLLGAGSLSCIGLATGIVGLLPRNPDRGLAAVGLLLNVGGVAFVAHFIPGAYL